jgi:RecB family exonuclease
VAREGTLAHWKKVASEVAGGGLAALLATRPLVGDAVQAKERARLLRDVETFLAYDWTLKLRRFVAVEQPFGVPEPLALDLAGAKLHVAGRIDRIDVEGDHALVRDLKTGREHPRAGDEEAPTPARDVQLGLYGLVARKLAAEWGLPRELQAAYVYVESGEERPFRADFGELLRATESWLLLAARLLAERSFPPAPGGEDCRHCAFRPACGDEVRQRSAAAAGSAAGALAGFLALRGGDG